MAAQEDRALLRAIAATLALGAGKLVAAALTASQALLASAVDSLTDGAVSALNLVLLRQARRPPDAGHPFGHGKLEALAALAQGAVLAMVVGGLAWNSGAALASDGGELPAVGPALATMAVSLAGSFSISVLLARAAARTGSLVLKTDAVHYRMDLLSGSAVIVGLGVTWFTGVPLADAAASLVVCALMARSVWGVLREAVGELMDRPFPAEELATVTGVLSSFPGSVLSWHDLRTRKSGAFRFVQVHVALPPELTFAEAHELSDRVEQALRTALPNCDAMVHADLAGDRDRTDRAHEG